MTNNDILLQSYINELIKTNFLIQTHCEFECEIEECTEECSLRRCLGIGKRLGLSKIMDKPEF